MPAPRPDDDLPTFDEVLDSLSCCDPDVAPCTRCRLAIRGGE